MPQQRGRDFYAILGVARDADENALKKAYKKSAVKWHPDKHASSSDKEKTAAEEKFKDVAEAFEVLSDKDKRCVYDRYGEEGLKASGGGGAPGGGMPFGGGGFPGGGVSFSFGGDGGMDNDRAQALFESLFAGGGLGGMRGMSGKRGGKDGMDPFAAMMGGMGGMGGMRRARSPTSPSRLDALAPGSVVVIQGLASQPQHNGSLGKVEAHNEARDRYVVELQDGKSLAIKPANVRQVVADAKVTGTTKDELNGKVCAAATFDRDSKRYRCEGLKSDGTVLSLKPENVILPSQTRVRIDGIESRPGLNGQVGAISAVDMAAGRYQVDLHGGDAIRVRFGAVAAC